MRYLSADHISNALKRGSSVEQFLGRSPNNPDYIRHIELRPSNGSVELWVYDAEDIGSEDWLDLYDFPCLDPNGSETPTATFQDAHSAIVFASEGLLADVNRWTNQFISQDEYLDYIRAGRPIRWPVPA